MNTLTKIQDPTTVHHLLLLPPPINPNFYEFDKVDLDQATLNQLDQVKNDFNSNIHNSDNDAANDNIDSAYNNNNNNNNADINAANTNNKNTNATPLTANNIDSHIEIDANKSNITQTGVSNIFSQNNNPPSNFLPQKKNSTGD